MPLSSDPNRSIGGLTLADLLNPMEFKTVLLATRDLENSQIAEFLGTTELVIQKVLTDVHVRTGCRNSGELVRRYVLEVTSGLLELSRLQRQLAELEARAAQTFHAPPSGLSTATDDLA